MDISGSMKAECKDKSFGYQWLDQGRKQEQACIVCCHQHRQQFVCCNAHAEQGPILLQSDSLVSGCHVWSEVLICVLLISQEKVSFVRKQSILGRRSSMKDKSFKSRRASAAAANMAAIEQAMDAEEVHTEALRLSKERGLAAGVPDFEHQAEMKERIVAFVPEVRNK